MGRSALIISVRPRFAQLIAEGTKTAELRRVRPRVELGAMVFIYATKPIQSVVAICQIEHLISGEKDVVWHRVRNRAAVSRETFVDYYSDVTVAHALILRESVQIAAPIPLADLRQLWPEFRPPQSFRYIPDEKLSSLEQSCLG